MRGTALSPRQREALNIIRHHVRVRGVPPSRSELARAMKVKGQATVDQQLAALARKGWVRLLPGVERGIQLLREGAPILEPDELPEVAAGEPIIPEERVPPRLDDYASFSELFEGPPDYFLRVRGDSMDNVGFATGDVVAVQREREPKEGDVVVARFGEGITLKRYHRNGSGVELQPESANAEHEPIQVEPGAEDFEIVGVVVGGIVAGR